MVSEPGWRLRKILLQSKAVAKVLHRPRVEMHGAPPPLGNWTGRSKTSSQLGDLEILHLKTGVIKLSLEGLI